MPYIYTVKYPIECYMLELGIRSIYIYIYIYKVSRGYHIYGVFHKVFYRVFQRGSMGHV